MATDDYKLKWQKDLDTFFPIFNAFVLEGYIDDEHPFKNENGEIDYCSIEEYFDKKYSNNSDFDSKKRVIVYDPTEAEDRRFKIYDERTRYVVDEEKSTSENQVEKLEYTESALSQHFWNILNDEDIDDDLISHRSSGPSLDFSKIHYAVTEEKGRSHKFQEKLESFFSGSLNGENGSDSSLVRYFERLVNRENSAEPSGYLFIIKKTSRLLTREGSTNGLSDEELMIFRQLLAIVKAMDEKCDIPYALKNKIVILANKASDLPNWFTDEVSNPFIKTITVSKPSEENKIEFFKNMRDSGVFDNEFITRYNEMGEDRTTNPVDKKFIAYTNDFTMRMLRKYSEYVKQNPISNPEKLGYSLSSFSAGDLTNPWDDEERIASLLNISELVSRKIKGQKFALDTAQAVITRAAVGVDRAENPNAPRVVLFLAGPTGTGKTELCKQIAETVFGSEDRIVRFDMSEYGQENSDQKLFGAPPGYVGYEEGGKLTNAIKKEPFSLVLFDEIEKAHNSVLDKFLQIVGDGRLTDGKGETVRFTDCIIVITSNAGVTPINAMSLGVNFNDPTAIKEHIKGLMNGDEAPEGEMNMEVVKRMENEGKSEEEIYAKVREHLRYNVKSYFHCRLGRPELYGRLEDGMVYYNYIGKNAVIDIVKGKVKGVIKTSKENLQIAEIVCPDEVYNAIAEYCQDSKVRSLGARGIIKSTGKIFSGSLSNYLASYIRQEDGKSKGQLVNIKLRCKCKNPITDNACRISSADDIVWEVFN